MATNNSGSIPVGKTPDNQKKLGQVENPKKSKIEATKDAINTTVVAIAGFGLGALGIIGPGDVQAGGLPPDELAKQEKALKLQGSDIKKPELAGKTILTNGKEQITFNGTNYETSDLKIIKPEGIKVEMDKIAEIEMLDLYKTKKGGDKVIERYNSLLDRYKSRIVAYYKETKEQGLPLRAVSFKIKTFDNYQQGKIFLFDATKTGKVGDMPERIGTALEGMFEIDEKGSIQFTQGEFEDFSVTDNIVLLKMNSNIEDLTKKSEDLTKKSEDLTKKSEDLTKKSEDLEEKIRWSNEFYNRILEAKGKK